MDEYAGCWMLRTARTRHTRPRSLVPFCPTRVRTRGTHEREKICLFAYLYAAARADELRTNTGSGKTVVGGRRSLARLGPALARAVL
eukprot:1933681-Prymnesium_polylepis.1